MARGVLCTELSDSSTSSPRPAALVPGRPKVLPVRGRKPPLPRVLALERAAVLSRPVEPSVMVKPVEPIAVPCRVELVPSRPKPPGPTAPVSGRMAPVTGRVLREARETCSQAASAACRAAPPHSFSVSRSAFASLRTSAERCSAARAAQSASPRHVSSIHLPPASEPCCTSRSSSCRRGPVPRSQSLVSLPTPAAGGAVLQALPLATDCATISLRAQLCKAVTSKMASMALARTLLLVSSMRASMGGSSGSRNSGAMYRGI
mmetsp:Transcript_32544/g.87067  ORF Transcript_32544/g.87067 Transcript_32544/m.87067 type:complete len:262 (-) Transcript_32544:565-1350(-)